VGTGTLEGRCSIMDVPEFSYQIVIPYDRPVNLVVASSFFRLSNGAVALPTQGSTAIPMTGSAKAIGSL
jgi:hypothetical protein